MVDVGAGVVEVAVVDAGIVDDGVNVGADVDVKAAVDVGVGADVGTDVLIVVVAIFVVDDSIVGLSVLVDSGVAGVLVMTSGSA